MKTVVLPDDVYDRICDRFGARMWSLWNQYPDETQAEWGKRVGVGQSTVSRWCKGVCLPRARKLCAISIAFGVSVDWLLGFSEERVAQPPRVVGGRRASQG